MTISLDTIKTLAAWLLAISALVGAILALLGKLKTVWIYVLRPAFRKVKPVLKVIAVLATLVIPNALIIGLVMRLIATYYFEADSLELIMSSVDAAT